MIINSGSNSLLICLSILGSGFLGSWHCAGMCGPVASLMAHKNKLWNYHTGRGLSYILMGVLAGWFGSFFFASDFLIMRWISGVLFAFVLIWMGLQMFFLKSKKLVLKFFWFQKYFHKDSPGWLLGVLSIFLPCGWLYSYVMAAAASQSPVSGGLIMALFFLSGLPALTVIPFFVRKTVRLSDTRKQRIAGGLLIFAGLYSLASFYFIH